jgi:hypothetical protein
MGAKLRDDDAKIWLRQLAVPKHFQHFKSCQTFDEPSRFWIAPSFTSARKHKAKRDFGWHLLKEFAGQCAI